MYTCFVARIPLRCPRLKLLTLYNNNNHNNNSSSTSSTGSSSRSNLLQNLPELKQLAKVVFEDLPPASSSSAAASAAVATGNSSLSLKAAAAVAVAQRGPVRVKLEREE